MRSARWIAACLMLLMAVTGSARDIENLADIHREAKIVADVMKSALRSELSGGLRVTSVSAEYLAKQGVLVSVRLNAPWLTITDTDAAIQINGQINLEEIPSMVENILSDLKIDLSPYEPESLETLRELRAEQRDLRLEQRDIRAQLRTLRRELVRADNSEEQRTIQRQIDNLERELAAVDTQYDALAKDIDLQYKSLRDYRERVDTPQPPDPPSAASPDIDALIARTVCDYGATLKSLGSEDYLTVALRRDNSTRYFAFKMDFVDSCGRGDMRFERLQERAYIYDS
ncbi:MAG: hypothetical protein ACFHXK_06550 [bacterium]